MGGARSGRVSKGEPQGGWCHLNTAPFWFSVMHQAQTLQMVYNKGDRGRDQGQGSSIMVVDRPDRCVGLAYSFGVQHLLILYTKAR